MNKEGKEDLKDFFKNAKEIKAPMGVPKDFKDMFKNVKEIKELPPVPENFDTTHLQEFIDEIEISEEKIAKYETLYSKKYNETEEFGRTQFVAMIVDLQQENQQLKDRIDKAFEYIDDLSLDFYDYECERLIVGKYVINDLLNLLKGDNNDN